ncbi:synaptopodin 2-like protein [Clonorchis sinensis]|uniref:Synaptopodin 2-like protein n=1 Tax=Clonorchis sinensis TaxID=79923 RepID=G7YSL8_CLOSI|nr:synaptopodin 2-like protein [Clonorchis sinensis]
MTYVERRLLLQNGPPWGFRLYEDFMEGLIVSKIRRQSPADHAGLREGDHVLAINGMDALDMSHARAVQIIDYASYSLEIIVGSINSRYSLMLASSVVSPRIYLIQTNQKNVKSQEKKTYADSSFYSDPNKYYPTVEEQIEMARRVADSLQDPENYAKGVNMFEKQRIRADKHVREGPDPEPDPIEEATPDELEHMTPPSPPPPPPPPPPSFPGLQPVNKPTVPIPPPPPMLPGQPKTVQEFLEKIKVFPKNRHTDLDPQKCFDIATALYTSDSRGAQMFAKRHARAKKWDAEANENGGSSVAQPAAAAAFGPSLKEEHRVKLPSKLPQKTPISQAKPKPIHVDLSHTDTADKPKTSLVDERAMSQPEPQTAVTEAMPKPFGQYSTASNAPPMFAVSPGLGSIDSESVNTGFDTESTQSGWRPVKFKVAQTAS